MKPFTSQPQHTRHTQQFDMETQARHRPPNLNPVWFERDSHSRYARNMPYSTHSAVFSPSVRSPSMPSPMYPRSPGYDHSMRRHEQALVERLDQRGRPRPLEVQDNRNTLHSLSPIAEANWDRRRSSFASVPSPRAPAPTPVSPQPPLHLQPPRPQTLAAETRSVLLSGLPPIRPLSATAERRPSLPPSLASPRRNSLQTREGLQAWGHVFFGNPTDASCFVTAMALRRSSESSSTDETMDDLTSPAKSPVGHNRVIIRARVRPRELTRKPFLLKREFDMDGLRATVPEPLPNSAARRLSGDHSKLNGLNKSRRRSSTASLLESELSPVRTTNTVPIRKFLCPGYHRGPPLTLVQTHIMLGLSSPSSQLLFTLVTSSQVIS